MRRVLTIVVIVAVALLLRQHYRQEHDRRAAEAAEAGRQEFAARADEFEPERDPREESDDDSRVAYRCDGRKRCPQMKSCEEATWFIEHCPGMEMDGDNDGVPCERQWCGSR